jgi:hypothetical protein
VSSDNIGTLIEQFAKTNADLLKKHWGKDGKKILISIQHYAGIADTVTTHSFDAFWAAYPASTRKADKAGCLRIWGRERLDDESTAVMSGLELLKVSADWTKNNGAFIPAPSVFLNQRRWEAVSTASDGLFAGMVNR